MCSFCVSVLQTTPHLAAYKNTCSLSNHLCGLGSQARLGWVPHKAAVEVVARVAVISRSGGADILLQAHHVVVRRAELS